MNKRAYMLFLLAALNTALIGCQAYHSTDETSTTAYSRLKTCAKLETQVQQFSRDPHASVDSPEVKNVLKQYKIHGCDK